MAYGNKIDKSIVLHRQNLNVLFLFFLQYDQDVVGPFHGRIYARTNYGSVTQAIRIKVRYRNSFTISNLKLPLKTCRNVTVSKTTRILFIEFQKNMSQWKNY